MSMDKAFQVKDNGKGTIKFIVPRSHVEGGSGVIIEINKTRRTVIISKKNMFSGLPPFELDFDQVKAIQIKEVDAPTGLMYHLVITPNVPGYNTGIHHIDGAELVLRSKHLDMVRELQEHILELLKI